MQPLISVIIPVYNAEKYLTKCIESVLEQIYQNLEIILINDGSTDESGNICDAYAKKDSRIIVVHKSNGGLSSSRNAGVAIASGDYITFLDSDDYISCDMYYQLYKSMQDSECSDAVSCARYVRVTEADEILKTYSAHEKKEAISGEEYLRELLLHKGDVSVCTKLFPRHIIKDDRFDENKLNEDLLFMLNIIPKINTVCFTGKIGYYYLTRCNSISNGYGKAVIDMASNSVLVNETVQKNYPRLTEEGNRFALFQNMAYLLWVPIKDCNKENSDYYNALNYLQRNFFRYGISNKYLGTKNKLTIVALLLCPKITISAFQRKHKS